ncbi:MAG: NTP transferase domain-containing protein [Ornithinibacter sp.]
MTEAPGAPSWRDAPAPLAADLTVVVLAGGSARRFGSDKLAAPLQGTTVLNHLLGRLPARWPVVVVGPPRPTDRVVLWVREEPAGGGPLAGVAAGLTAVTTPYVAVVAGDMPHAARALVALEAALRSSAPEVAGAVGVDEGGAANPLLGVYRTSAVREGIPHPAHGVAAKRLLDLAPVEVAVAGLPGRDVDTTEDLVELDRAD